MASQKFTSVVLLLVGTAFGCTGTIGDVGGSRSGSGSSSGPGGTSNPGPGGVIPPGGGVLPPGGSGGGGSGTAPGAAADPNAAGEMPLRRLTRREYNNTVRDLLGDTSNPADGFPLDKDEFLYHRAGLVSSQDLDTLKDAAQALARGVEAKATMLAPCDAGGDEAACAKKFVTSFGQRAFRRPLATDESDRLMALYQAGRSTMMLSYAGAISLLVEGMLQSPAFLYHWELGNNAPIVEGKVIRLGPWEQASRLSYFIWGSMPDQMLFDAAAGNKLGTQAEVEAQAKRMLGDMKARDSIAAFADEWLNLEQIFERPKDPGVYPEFKDDLKAAMSAEIRSFLPGVVFEGDGKLTSLLTATSSFVNQPLAAVYGLSGVQGTAMKPMNLDANQRAGLLTRAGFLTVTGATDGSHPVKRGRRVYERLLCGVLPNPPKDVPPAADAKAGGTTRHRFEEHDKNPCTGACHNVMDKLGFAFEHYDGIGKYRDMDNGGMVDSSGSIQLDNANKPFKDARELSQLLASSPTVSRCFATQWLRYTFKREETEADRASLDGVVSALSKSGSVVDMLVGVASSRSFRYRSPGIGEKLQ
jgi:hypothetical protein